LPGRQTKRRRIRSISQFALAGGRQTFSVAEKNGEHFAAELDVLAALIRARVIRARVDAEEAE
jgi:hypothetical protein